MANSTATCNCGCGKAPNYCLSISRTALTEAAVPANSPAWKVQRRNERRAR